MSRGAWALVGGLALFALGCAQSSREVASAFAWSELPPLPDGVGLAGACVGVSGDALIVAGGANFPHGPPWEGHPKVWHDRVLVLEEPEGPWREVPTRLPRPLAYGVALSWNDSLLCLGGGDATRHHADSFSLRWDGTRLVIETLPPLPTGVAFAAGALLGDTAFVAGGLDAPGATAPLHALWSLDLASTAGDRSWRELPPWPGPPRHLAVAGAQDGSFFLFGGIDLRVGEGGAPERVRPYLSDGYRYTPGRGWRALAALPHPVAAAPGPAPSLGPAHLALLGGDDGSIATPPGDTHPGFRDDVLLYHTITDTWVATGRLPRDPRVTTPAVQWRGNLVVASGETRSGIRAPSVLLGTPVRPKPAFGALDYGVLSVYLICLAGTGFYFARREKTTEDFFLGGRRVVWWAAGISIFGTQLSAITFMAIPAKAFATDWVYFLLNVGILLMGPVVVYAYLPFFRRLNVTTAYEYLEHRFNLPTRLLGAASFVVFQVGRMGIVLFLPALALAAVTGIDTRTCIVVMAVLCTLYTVLGGIEAVIWTDVLQVVVLCGGALVALGVIANALPGGPGEIVSTALLHDKLRLVDARWDWTGSALSVIVLAMFFNNLVPYTADQAVVQRYLTPSDERRAASAVWTGTFLALPASIVFFGLGTALFAFYRAHPERLNPLGQGDQVFAWFIVQELPAGLSGLLIAGVFAAAMSSLDSSMNSIATTVTTDFYRRFRPEADDRRCLALARGLTLLLGALAAAVALWFAQAGIQSLFDQFLELVGLLGGTLAGLFALGIFTREATGPGALVGAAASLGLLGWVATATDLSGLLYAAIGIVSCMAIGWLASLVLPRPARSIEGLTIHTLRR